MRLHSASQRSVASFHPRTALVQNRVSAHGCVRVLNSVIGNAGATVTIQVPKKGVSTVPGSAVATLYYYESNFTDTGGKLYTPEWKGELQITKTDGKDDLETRFETKEQEDIFKNSFFMRAGLTFSVDNGDLKVELN